MTLAAQLLYQGKDLSNYFSKTVSFYIGQFRKSSLSWQVSSLNAWRKLSESFSSNMMGVFFDFLS